MAVELEEIALGGLFYRNRKVMQIREEDFGNIIAIAGELFPIPIDPIRLWKLGFSRSITTGVSYKAWQGITLYLKPGTLERWVIHFEGVPKVGFVQHIHQVQRLWFNLFGEHLHLNSRKKEEAPVSVPIAEPGAHTSDQPYYFTWDSRLLIRTGRVAVWRVGKESPLFQYSGGTWGLTLMHGQASEEDRILGGKWLKKHLENMRPAK